MENMGSPSQSLNVPEALRSWYDYGLEFLFLPEGLPAFEDSSAAGQQRSGPAYVPPVQQAPQQGHQFNQQPHHNQQQPQAPQGAPQQPVQQVMPQGATAQPVSGGQQPQQQQPVPQQQAPVQKPPVQKQPQRRLLDVGGPTAVQGEYPAPWDQLFQIASGGSRRIAFTYVNLGLDLGGRPDNERRAMFKRMIGYLGWPAGTAAFWPCSVLIDDVLTPNAKIFWQGISQLGVRHIACFGADALQVLYPYANTHREVIYKNNVAIHLLPDPDKLAAMDGRSKVQAVSALKGLFPDLEQ